MVFNRGYWHKTFSFESSSLPELDDQSVFQRTHGVFVEQMRGFNARARPETSIAKACANTPAPFSDRS
jgi:hypothetical protein